MAVNSSRSLNQNLQHTSNIQDTKIVPPYCPAKEDVVREKITFTFTGDSISDFQLPLQAIFSASLMVPLHCRPEKNEEKQ